MVKGEREEQETSSGLKYHPISGRLVVKSDWTTLLRQENIGHGKEIGGESYIGS